MKQDKEAITEILSAIAQAQLALSEAERAFQDSEYPVWRRDREALQMLIAALRPVSREQVEKVWRGEWNYSHTTEIDHFAVVKCSKCGHEAFAIALYVKDGNFCPACGAPMTDEAVQMVMERLEALYDTGN